MKRGLGLFVVVAVLSCQAVGAQAQTGQAPPAPPAAPTPPEEIAFGPPQLVNIRVEIVISEQGGGAPPVKKTATVITGDRRAAAVRATGEAEIPNSTGRTFPNRADRVVTYAKADVRPLIERDGRIRTLVTLEYLSPTSQTEGRGTQLKVEPLLESGRPLVVSESTDPTSDRGLTVQVTATILK